MNLISLFSPYRLVWVFRMCSSTGIFTKVSLKFIDSRLKKRKCLLGRLKMSSWSQSIDILVWGDRKNNKVSHNCYNGAWRMPAINPQHIAAWSRSYSSIGLHWLTLLPICKHWPKLDNKRLWNWVVSICECLLDWISLYFASWKFCKIELLAFLLERNSMKTLQYLLASLLVTI